MNQKQKKMLQRIVISAVLLLFVNLVPLPYWAKCLVYAAAYLTVGWDILRKAALGIKNRQVFDENFLMTVATLGAIALAIVDGNGDFNEAVAVMLFYQIGELFQSIAVGQSRKNIAALMDIRPDYANIEVDGKLEQVDPEEVAVGSVIVIQPGERIPLDGTVLEGSSSVNTAALTGESVPRDVKPGDAVISGCINMTGLLHVSETGIPKGGNNQALLEKQFPPDSKIEVVVKGVEGDRVSLTLPSVVAAQEAAAAEERDAQAALRANRESARSSGFGNLGSLLDSALARGK